MPWQPNQHRLFCAKCKDGKGPKDMCRMCHEGIKKTPSKTRKKV